MTPLPASTRFDGRTALVTGAGTGIGRATAMLLAARGAHVVLAGRRAEPLQALADAITSGGGQAYACAGDVATPDGAQRAVAAAVERCGGLDIAFNNAGVEGAFAPIEALTPQDFDHTVGINLRGVWLCCRAEIAAMRAAGHGGAIVNTSSWLAHGAFPGSSIYSASKAALDGMIRALAQETATDGIRINNVNPGIIDTPMLRRFGDEAAMQPFVQHTPMRRLGTAEDVAEAVAWLCSDGARFVTGQNLRVDGGYAIPGHRAWVAGAVGARHPSVSV